MAPAAVKTLASSFEGLNGATALSTIAFSVVFIVLIFLTLVIYAMRLVSRFAGAEKPAAAPAARAAAPAAAGAASSAAAADEELVAVIAAAIFAQTGTMMRIKSIVPAGTHLIGTDNVSWINCGRLEGLQGALSDRWN
ncbi:MAG: OadG family protein [Pyramidobacter sp.]|jgi:sodium pump decarboxylase gamma subunit|nr:OadG family protein [Pyramidobacter sp.]